MWGKILVGGSHDSCFPTPELVKSISGNSILLIYEHFLFFNQVGFNLYFIRVYV